jgi:MFS family permease
VDGDADEVTESVFVGLKQALVDTKVWLLVFIETAVVVGLSFTYFFPSIVQTLGYGNVQTLLLTAPPFFLAFLFSIINAWHCGRTGERAYHIIFACALSAIGNVMAITIKSTAGRYVAMFLMAIGVFSGFQLILSWISAIIPRPKVKRGVSLALATAIANSTNIATAYLYPKTDAPTYLMGGIVLCVALGTTCAAVLVLRFWLKKLNAEADRRQGHEGANSNDDLSFRYVL